VSNDLFIEAFLRSESVNRYVRLIEPVYIPEDGETANNKSLWGSTQVSIFIRKDLGIRQPVTGHPTR
jgi:hypothetical protein